MIEVPKSQKETTVVAIVALRIMIMKDCTLVIIIRLLKKGYTNFMYTGCPISQFMFQNTHTHTKEVLECGLRHFSKCRIFCHTNSDYLTESRTPTRQFV